jgi:Zn-finger nucleic acid-binding protein
MLECPNCGAPASTETLKCEYCRVQLQSAQCAQCFGMMFVGTKHCSHCGAKAYRPTHEMPVADGPRKCPRCTKPLAVSAVGEAFLEDCAGCGGLWVDTDSFKKICTRKERSAAFTGMGSPVPVPYRAVNAQAPVQYLACPDCGRFMNRLNFARHSGVIVDVCKTHGTWFDYDELRMILEFIEAGGLDAAREKEVEKLRVEAERAKLDRGNAVMFDADSVRTGRQYGGVVEAAGGLLKFLLD